MLYNDEFTFMVKYKQNVRAIRVPRKNSTYKDFSSSELYEKVKEEFDLNHVILTLNGKKIPCNKDFSISFLQYLPYQRIQVEDKEDIIIAPQKNSELIIEYNTKELLQDDQPEKKSIKYDLKDDISVLDLKKRFAKDISKGQHNPINPYELIFTTKTRYISDDETAFFVSRTPLIATYRSDNNALYPLFFRICNYRQEVVKKWYNKNTTFGQIAFDLFGENYYKYKFDFSYNDAKRKYENKTIGFSTLVDSIKYIQYYEYQILNNFRVTENHERYYRFDFNKNEYRGRIPCSKNGNEINLIKEIQQEIKSDIQKNYQCDKLLFLNKYNLRANINDYGNPFEKFFYCIQLDTYSSYVFNIYFYNEDKTENICMSYCSTVFNLRYTISVFKNVNIEDVIIFFMNIDDFKKAIKKNNTPKVLDDLIILNYYYYDYYYNNNNNNKINHYIVYIINSESNNTYISKKLLDNYNEQENPEKVQNEHDKLGQKEPHSTIPDSPIQQCNSDIFESDYNKIKINSDSKQDIPIISQQPRDEEPVKRQNKRQFKPSVTDQTNLNDETQKVPKYIKLNFTYKESSQKLQILQLSTDEELSTLEPKIRRFYKINTKIDFYYEDEPNKNKINNLKFNQIKNPRKNIMIVKTNIELNRKIYYQFYGNEKMFEIDNVKTVDGLRKRICKVNKISTDNQIDIIFGGKVLDDDTKLDRLYSEDNQNVLTIYNNRPITDFSGTVNLNRKNI